MQNWLGFPSGIFWRSIVKRKTKETFCLAKGWRMKDELSLTAASLARMDRRWTKLIRICFSWHRRGLDSRSLKSFFFRSVFIFLSFPAIFDAYSRNICAHLVGDLASLSLWPSRLDDSPACVKEPRRVFVPRSWLLSHWRTSEPGGRA